MNKNEFLEEICDNVQEKMGETFHVELRNVTKNNGVILQGLAIMSDNSNVAPTIYMDHFYDAYMDGVPMDILVKKIVTIYSSDAPTKGLDMEFFKHFNKVKDRICFRIISREHNKDLLDAIPHLPFLDLEICFFYAYEGKELGSGTILIHNSHMELWGTTAEELMRLARVNTASIYPWRLYPMKDILLELMDREVEYGDVCFSKEEEMLLADIPMKVLCNAEKIFGASCLLYKGVMEAIAGDAHTNFFILPSSIHEGATC